MGQTPLGFSAINSFGALAPLRLNAQGQLQIEAGGQNATYDITAAVVIKATPGYVGQINVIVAGSGVGSVNDCTTTGAAAITNQIAVIPETVGPLQINWNTTAGIVVVPGTGQTIALSWT